MGEDACMTEGRGYFLEPFLRIKKHFLTAESDNLFLRLSLKSIGFRCENFELQGMRILDMIAIANTSRCFIGHFLHCGISVDVS